MPEMPKKTESIQVRVTPETKEKAREVFERHGLTISAAVTMFIHQALLVDGLPFRTDDQPESVSEQERKMKSN